jgi:hypothetical protein
MRRLVRCGRLGGSESWFNLNQEGRGFKNGQLQEQKQIPPLRCGMTTKKRAITKARRAGSGTGLWIG